MSANSGRQEKGEEERSKEYIKLKSKQGKLNLKQRGGSCTGPGLGCIQDFPAWAKILVSNKNPKEIPVRDELGGLCEQRKSGGIFPGDGESRDVAELGCSGGVPTFLWHSGVMAAKENVVTPGPAHWLG